MVSLTYAVGGASSTIFGGTFLGAGIYELFYQHKNLTPDQKFEQFGVPSTLAVSGAIYSISPQNPFSVGAAVTALFFSTLLGCAHQKIYRKKAIAAIILGMSASALITAAGTIHAHRAIGILAGLVASYAIPRIVFR